MFEFAKDGTLLFGGVYGKYYFHDLSRPLVVAFSTRGSNVTKAQAAEGKSPWAFDVLKGMGVNVLSFCEIAGDKNYFRDPAFLAALPKIAAALPDFVTRLGYGASMGGYGASAFSEVLGLERLLLLCPITTRAREINSWDFDAGRSLSSYKLNWTGPWLDGATTKAKGYVLYDPIYHLDRRHALRYEGLEKLPFPAMGHHIPVALRNLGLIKPLLSQFIADAVDVKAYHRIIRARRTQLTYYQELLSYPHKRLTPRRRLVVLHHFRTRFPDDYAAHGIGALPQQLPKAQSQAEVLDLIAKGLAQSGEFALAEQVMAKAAAYDPDNVRLKRNHTAFRKWAQQAAALPVAAGLLARVKAVIGR